MPSIQFTQKAEVVQLLLATEGRVMLCLDATQTGVIVPRRFASDKGLRLILNKNMPQSIEITPHGIESELRFGGIPHFCVIPFAALWGVFNPDTNHGMFWTESMPEEIRQQHALEEAESHSVKMNLKIENKEKKSLRVIEGGEDGLIVTSPVKRARPNLRVVK